MGKLCWKSTCQYVWLFFPSNYGLLFSSVSRPVRVYHRRFVYYVKVSGCGVSILKHENALLLLQWVLGRKDLNKWDVILCADCWLREYGLQLGRGVLGFVWPSQRETPKVRQGITNKLDLASKIMRRTVWKRHWNWYVWAVKRTESVSTIKILTEIEFPLKGSIIMIFLLCFLG